jgi:hypothetical protein
METSKSSDWSAQADDTELPREVLPPEAAPLPAEPGAPGPLGPADSQVLHADTAMDRALVEFRLGARSRQVEDVCTAYLSLRRAAAGAELKLSDAVAMAGRAAWGSPEAPIDARQTQQALDLVVSAFSHRRCFMCKGGMTRCDQCDGSGGTPTSRCPHCLGLAAAPCTFCQGSGWADRTTIPSELRGLVLRKQLDHVRQDMHRLGKVVADLKRHASERGPRSVRLQLVGWLLRLSGRTTQLLECRVLPPGAEFDRLSRAAAAIRTLAHVESED